ncbi:MAG: protein tyrosine phosphatase [Candidatus Bathyarchaeota archaeon]|nr:MAG: protein tyrosine phosphatase [Candidatus Bathyarchaeota archaeon]
MILKSQKNICSESAGCIDEVNNIPKKILFVCTGNMDRSPTAENLLSGREDFEVMSAGTWIHARRRISESILEWADQIFVMEREHKDVILRLKPEVEDKITVLDIPDNYRRDGLDLIEMLKTKLSKHLDIRW